MDKNQKPLYVAKRSGFSAINIWLVLFFWLIIPLIVQICLVFRAKSYRLKFYEGRVVRKIGLIFRKESQVLFLGVNTINIDQGFWGDLFDYGTLHIIGPGPVDMLERGIFAPHSLKRFLQGKFVNPATPHMVVSF